MMDERCLQVNAHSASLSKREQTGEGGSLCSRAGQPCRAPMSLAPFAGS